MWHDNRRRPPSRQPWLLLVSFWRRMLCCWATWCCVQRSRVTMWVACPASETSKSPKSPRPEPPTENRNRGGGLSTQVRRSMATSSHHCRRLYLAPGRLETWASTPLCCSQPCNPAQPDDNPSLLQRQQHEQIYCNELVLLRTTLPCFASLRRYPPRLPVACRVPRASCPVPRARVHLTRLLLVAGRFGEGPPRSSSSSPV
jgi:hypothetical protein